MVRIVKGVGEIEMMAGNSPAFIDEILGYDANGGWELGIGRSRRLAVGCRIVRRLEAASWQALTGSQMR